MKKKDIIKSKREFNYIINNCSYIKNKNFVIYIKKKEDKIPLFGIAISKKVGNAVERNKLKRQTRMIIDILKQNFKNYNDYIIMIKKDCKLISFKEMKESLENLIERSNQ